MPMAAARTRRTLRFCCRILVSLIIFVLLLEFVIRIVMPVDTFIAVPNRWDPGCGLRMIENGYGYIERPEYRCEFQINRHGLRERETPLGASADPGRILFLGDSYTCGYGVAPEETFSREVERLTGRRTINAGIGATGTAHQLAYYLDEGRLYDADLVVLAFVPNDFRDSAASGLFTIENDILLRHEAPRTIATAHMEITRRLPGYHSLLGHSHALARFKQVFAAWWYGRRGGGGRATSSDGSLSLKRRDFTLRLVRELDAAVRADGAELLVVVVPLAKGLDISPEPLRDLARRLRNASIEVLELEDAHDRFEASGVKTYYADDGHWNAEGHRRYGALIAAAIQDRFQDSSSTGN